MIPIEPDTVKTGEGNVKRFSYGEMNDLIL